MINNESELDEQLKSLGVTEDNGEYDSDETPTNSPRTSLLLHPNKSDYVTNYPSSKTSGFWEDTNFGRLSQISNYSTDSESSLSWGEDNIEGEATRQVSLLFDQLDDLLYQDSATLFHSYPVVPLPLDEKETKLQRKAVERKNAISNKNILNLRHRPVPAHDLTEKLQQSVADAKKKEKKAHFKQADLLSDSDSDSDDEVVWQRLKSKSEVFPSNNNASSKGRSSGRSIHYRSSKLATITEKRDKDPYRENFVSHSYYINNDSTTDNLNYIKDAESEEEYFLALENKDKTKVQDYREHSSVSVPGILVNMAGGIYAKGFAPASQTSSPLLLPTPATPPGVPVNPTAVMVEESAFWSSRFLHLRVRGHAVEPLLLKEMESQIFSKKSGSGRKWSVTSAPGHDVKFSIDFSPSSIDSDEEDENSSVEVVLAQHGSYNEDSGILCLVGQYLPRFGDSLGSRKPSYEIHKRDNGRLNNDNRSDVATFAPSDEDTGYLKNRDLNRSDGADRITVGRVIGSSSSDPEVLKEQVLVLLFDSLWPQVINTVGGLVHRYACHLLESAAASVPSSPHRGHLIETNQDPVHPSSTSRLHSLSASSGRQFSARRLLNNRLPARSGGDGTKFSASLPSNMSHHDRETHQLTTVLPLAPDQPSRLHTARTLMQLHRSPLSPVWSEAANVVSLPSLEVPKHRPLSSVSSLTVSTIASSVHSSAISRNRHHNFTIDIENAQTDKSSSAGSSPSSPWIKSKPPGTAGSDSFLPPIRTSLCLSAASSSVDISKVPSSPFRSRDRRPVAGRLLTRRNSDSMARVHPPGESNGEEKASSAGLKKAIFSPQEQISKRVKTPSNRKRAESAGFKSKTMNQPLSPLLSRSYDSVSMKKALYRSAREENYLNISSSKELSPIALNLKKNNFHSWVTEQKGSRSGNIARRGDNDDNFQSSFHHTKPSLSASPSRDVQPAFKGYTQRRLQQSEGKPVRSRKAAVPSVSASMVNKDFLLESDDLDEKHSSADSSKLIYYKLSDEKFGKDSGTTYSLVNKNTRGFLNRKENDSKKNSIVGEQPLTKPSYSPASGRKKWNTSTFGF